MTLFSLLVSLGLLVPAPDPTPPSAEEVRGAVLELQASLRAFEHDMISLKPENVNDMKLYGEAQHRRLKGVLLLLRSAEREFSLVKEKTTRDALLEGCAEMRVLLESAQKRLRGFEDKANAVDVANGVGNELVKSFTFRRYYQTLPDFSKPRVIEMVTQDP